MLAEAGFLDILTESFRRQRLEDPALEDECYGNLRSPLEIQPYKMSSRKSGSTREKIAKEENRNATNINGNTKRSTVSTELSKPLKVNEKDRKTYEEKPEKLNASSNERDSFYEDGKNRLDKPDCFQEILSSSEEELRDLCSELNKTFQASKEIEIPRVIPQESTEEIPQRTKNAKICNSEKQFTDIDKDLYRKRYKSTRGIFKKKIKFSRPSLNLHKMLATRFSPLHKDFVSYGNFCPIEKI